MGWLVVAVLVLGVVLVWNSNRPPVPLRVFQVATNLGLHGRMALLSEGTLVAATYGDVQAIDPGGRMLWRHDCELGGNNSVLRADDDRVVTVVFDPLRREYSLVITGPKNIVKLLTSTNYLSSEAWVVRPDGAVIGIVGLEIVSVDRHGAELWRRVTASKLYGGLAVTPGGELYFHDHDQTNWWRVLLAPDGTELWQRPASEMDRFPPAFAEDGSFYQGHGTNSPLVAYTSDGIERWRLKHPCWALCSPVIGGDGTVYLTARNQAAKSSLLAVSPDGRLKWEFALNSGHGLRQPAIGPDGSLYLVTGDRWVRAIRPDGTLKWKYRIEAKLALPHRLTWETLKSTWHFKFGLRQYELHGPPLLTPDGRLLVNFGHTGSIYSFDTTAEP